ncbi:putative inositol-pentakisphosphate 2-kinase [Helianthus annuus]|nr:putative inositol-pentakisphosphate 2-kinase [Helianthus annuus]
MAELILEAKDAGDWIYRGEGAANLILSYTGSSSSFVRSKYLLLSYSSSSFNYLFQSSYCYKVVCMSLVEEEEIITMDRSLWTRFLFARVACTSRWMVLG